MIATATYLILSMSRLAQTGLLCLPMRTTLGRALSFLNCGSRLVRQGRVRSCEARTMRGLLKEGNSRKDCKDMRLVAALRKDSVLDSKSWPMSAGCRFNLGTTTFPGD